MAVRTLRRGHRFPFTHVNGINYVTVFVYYFVRTGLRAGITAI